MSKKENAKDIYKIADFNNSRIKFSHTILNSFSVIEDFEMSTSDKLQTHTRPDFMSIFIITNGTGKISLNMEEIVLKENSLIHIAPNTLIGSPTENYNCTVSGVSFTTDFLAEIGLPEKISEIFHYFSTKYYPV